MSAHNWLARELFFPLGCALDRQPQLPRLMREARRVSESTFEEVAARQSSRLQAMAEHAARVSPYYREQLERAGISPGNVRTVGDLAALPLATKAVIREHMEAMLDRSRPLMKATTGGTTGEPMSTWRDLDCYAYRSAVTWETNRWVGWRPGDSVAMVWGARQDLVPSPGWKARLRNALLERTRILDVSGATEEQMLAFLRELAMRPAEILYGYASAFHQLTRLAVARGQRLARPRSIVLTAEPLGAEDRAFCEAAWGAPVYSRYACREFGVIASECPSRCGLHVLMDSVAVEIVRPEGAGETEPGEVVVTDLANFGLPTLRYPMADASRFLGPSRCSLPYPVLAPIDGRVSDFLIAPDGRYISGVILNYELILDISGFAGLQVVQESRELLRLRVVPAQGWGEATKQELQRRLELRFGPGMRVEFEEVPAIEKTASGKLRFTICKVPVAWAG